MSLSSLLVPDPGPLGPSGDVREGKPPHSSMWGRKQLPREQVTSWGGRQISSLGAWDTELPDASGRTVLNAKCCLKN